ncbi:MAG TPA: class I SAM-dependent methyltransferase [Gaiellaceae bacterium]|nr:class I SAM-dependent methyltransferase [Gaiellaceae bacterium]
MKREDWNRRYAGVDSLWSAKPNRFLVAEVEALEPGRALDLACGEGQNAVWLASLGWEVTAVDYADVAVAKGIERAARAGVAVEFQVRDLLDYLPEARAFDLVLILYLHMSSDGRRIVLERAADSVAPGGTLVLIGHDLLNLTEGVGGPSDQDLLFTPDDVVAELPGLEVERAERLLRDVDGQDRPAIDALVRARRA